MQTIELLCKQLCDRWLVHTLEGAGRLFQSELINDVLCECNCHLVQVHHAMIPTTRNKDHFSLFLDNLLHSAPVRPQKAANTDTSRGHSCWGNAALIAGSQCTNQCTASGEANDATPAALAATVSASTVHPNTAAADSGGNRAHLLLLSATALRSSAHRLRP